MLSRHGKTNPPYLLLLNRFEDLYDAFLLVSDVDALKYLAVFAPANLPDDLIIVLVSADHQQNCKGLSGTCHHSSLLSVHGAHPHCMLRFS